MKHIYNSYLNLIYSGSPLQRTDSSAFGGFIYRLFDTLSKSIEKGICSFRRWREHRAAVAALSVLDNHLLRDIGLHRGDVHAFGRGAVSIGDLNRLRTGKPRITSQPGARTHFESLPRIATVMPFTHRNKETARKGRLDSAA